MTFNDITHPEDFSVGDDLWYDFLSGKIDNVNLEKRYIRKDGKIVWTHVSSKAIRNLSGELIQTVTVIENVTERKEAEDLRNKLFAQEKEARLDAQRPF